MLHLLSALILLAAFAAPAYAQTMKALMYSTNGNVIAPNIAFTNQVSVLGVNIGPNGVIQYDGNDIYDMSVNSFVGAVNFDQPTSTRANLGFSTNLNTLWTATNAESARNAIGAGTGGGGGSVDLSTTNATGVLPLSKGGTGATNAATSRTNLGLGPSNSVSFEVVNTTSGLRVINGTNEAVYIAEDISEFNTSVYVGGVLGIIFPTNNSAASATRTNLGLGATDSVQFADVVASTFETLFGEIQITDDAITSKANIIITNQTAATNGLLFIYRTNREAFLGLANLIASNNTTVSNETLFRVGVAEATNRAAQFGFRSTNTNGSGVAVFSVFGYNALMMIGADASTNAVIYSGGGTNNEVMTLIRDGATEFARPIRFSTNASTRPSTNAPANTTNVAAWVEMRIGTNSYRVPLYQ